jgi:hypothetical protein
VRIPAAGREVTSGSGVVPEGDIRSFQNTARYNERSNCGGSIGGIILADDKTYKAEYLGSGTFVISKPKRKKTKIRQSKLRNPERGSRK